jgi:hypothetical protein
MYMSFEQWWFHGHLGYPPNEGDVFELPAGGTVTAELACDKVHLFIRHSTFHDFNQGSYNREQRRTMHPHRGKSAIRAYGSANNMLIEHLSQWRYSTR